MNILILTLAILSLLYTCIWLAVDNMNYKRKQKKFKDKINKY